jgi:sulfatase maturation enzyme AslB (radical SAM superfamily)
MLHFLSTKRIEGRAAIGNAVLWTNNFCPLSYRSVDEAEYKKAIILFYEQNSARYFKELFIEQFKFAVKNYFLA